MNKDLLIKQLIKAQDKTNPKNALPLPQMSPDLFDLFIDWIYARVDLRSFAQSSDLYKYKQFKKFIKEQPSENLQLVLSGLHWSKDEETK
jgi:hypothetical protein